MIPIHLPYMLGYKFKNQSLHWLGVFLGDANVLISIFFLQKSDYFGGKDFCGRFWSLLSWTIFFFIYSSIFCGGVVGRGVGLKSTADTYIL